MEEKSVKIHVLKNGATVITTSPHPFQFSDGTVSEGQDKELCERFTLKREFVKRGEIKGMAINEVRMTLSLEQQGILKELCTQADIVLIPFPVLTALREQGIRAEFPNALSFNATQATQRAAPNEKVVDVENWSY